MRNRLTMLLTLGLVSGGHAQNLVPNPSFEEYTTCPNALNLIENATGWWSFGGSPDLFNACDDDSLSVPYNAVGFQWPSDGDGYAGLGTYPQYGKEFIQAELLESLDVGVNTYISLRVSPGGFGFPDWTSPSLAASHIGLRFSMQPIETLQEPQDFHPNAATLFMTEVLDDTAAWTILSTVFQPDSAYNFVQIGNFFQDELCSYLILDEGGIKNYAYAFVDQVCVSKEPATCDQVVSTSNEHPSLYPSTVLFAEDLQVSVWGVGEGRIVRGQVMDVGARIVSESNLVVNDGGVTWSLAGLASGFYFVRLALHDGSSVGFRCYKATR